MEKNYLATTMNKTQNKRVDEGNLLKIRLESSDYIALEDAVSKIHSVITSAGHTFALGPIPMKTRSIKITLNASPHVYGLTKETYKMKIHTRLIWINEQSVDDLMNAQITSTISIKIEVDKKRHAIT